MKKRPLYMVELTAPLSDPAGQNFTENFQAAVLLALLGQGLLTKRQFGLCLDGLHKPWEGGAL